MGGYFHPGAGGTADFSTKERFFDAKARPPPPMTTDSTMHAPEKIHELSEFFSATRVENRR
jgi:hypothetical protein